MITIRMHKIVKRILFAKITFTAADVQGVLNKASISTDWSWLRNILMKNGVTSIAADAIINQLPNSLTFTVVSLD